MVFRRIKKRAELGLAQSTQLLEGVFAMTRLLALAGVDSLILAGQKKKKRP